MQTTDNSQYNSDVYDEDKYLLLYDKTKDNKLVIKIPTEKVGYIINLKEFTLSINYTIKNGLNLLLYNLLTNNNTTTNEDIGLKDKDLFMGLEIIRRINENKNKNIILKLFDFFPNSSFGEDYFSIKKPNLSQFLNDMKIDDKIYNNKIIIIPLTVYDHHSLLLIYNKNVYILDFGLKLVIDDKMFSLKKNLDEYDNSITNFINQKNYNQSEIWRIIDDYIDNDNNNTNNMKETLKNIIKNEEDQNKFFELIDAYIPVYAELKNVRILKYNPRIDLDIFINENLEENITVLNVFGIQGSQGCGYFCLAAFKYITSKEFNFEDILNLFNDATFQINVLKTLCDELLNDERKIFIINEKMSKNEYTIYHKNNSQIGIRKSFKELRFKNIDNNYLSIKIEYLLDLIAIHNMLIERGYKIE